VLFNEPKLLKSILGVHEAGHLWGFSALQRAEIAEMGRWKPCSPACRRVSVLFNEPKLLKSSAHRLAGPGPQVSVLFNEPKLLKCMLIGAAAHAGARFSALQRAEIAEISTEIPSESP